MVVSAYLAPSASHWLIQMSSVPEPGFPSGRVPGGTSAAGSGAVVAPDTHTLKAGQGLQVGNLVRQGFLRAEDIPAVIPDQREHLRPPLRPGVDAVTRHVQAQVVGGQTPRFTGVAGTRPSSMSR